jgi:RNA polymerase sigma-70 factor, ECF subfamily
MGWAQLENPPSVLSVLYDDRDAALMAHAATGDLSAFEELVIRNQSTAWALAFHYLSDSAEAEDVVQEAFLRLLKSAPRYRPTARFRTYLARIVVNLCLDFRSKKHLVYSDTLPENADTENIPDLVLLKQEAAREVKQALADLPPAQRIALILRHLEDFTYSEIAETMSISVKAVDSLLQRGRQALRSRFHSSPR